MSFALQTPAAARSGPRREPSRKTTRAGLRSPTCSANDILPLEDHYARQQQPSRIRATHTRVMPETLPRDLRLEHVAPELHVSRKKVRPQVLEKLHAPDDVQRQVSSDRHHRRLHRRLEDHRTKQREGG